MKTETGAPMYFEAVPVERELPEINTDVFAIANREQNIITAWWDGKIWYSTQANEDEDISVTHWIRPLPLPVGVPTDEEIDLMTKDICRKKFGNIYFREDDLDSIEISLKAMRSRLTPLLSAQAAEIEQLKSQLSTEQAKGRERALPDSLANEVDEFINYMINDRRELPEFSSWETIRLDYFERYKKVVQKNK